MKLSLKNWHPIASARLEDVGQTASDAENLNDHALDLMGFNVAQKPLVSIADDLKWRSLAARRPSFAADGDLDSPGHLIRPTVKGQRRDQTDDTLGTRLATSARL